jgi:hypothetical protein
MPARLVRSILDVTMSDHALSGGVCDTWARLQPTRNFTVRLQFQGRAVVAGRQHQAGHENSNDCTIAVPVLMRSS